MDRQVNLPGEQGLFDFFGEQSFATRLGERGGLQVVAGGFDDFDFGRKACFRQLTGHVVRLPQR